MDSQPQNPEFRNNPENFHPCFYRIPLKVDQNCSSSAISLPSYKVVAHMVYISC